LSPGLPESCPENKKGVGVLKTPFVLLALVIPAIGSAQIVSPYFLHTVELPAGASSFNVVGIDEAGNIYGNAIYSGQSKPTIWTAVSQTTRTLRNVGSGVYADGTEYKITSINGV
jgi:hypothetical protein